MSLAAPLHRQYKTARTETRCHLLLKIWQMAIQTSASRGYVLFDIKVAFMPAVVWCHKGHTRILKLSAGCGHILRSVQSLERHRSLQMQSAAWLEIPDFAVRFTAACYIRNLHMNFQVIRSASVPLICQSSVSVFHLPEGCGVRRERTATSKVVRLPGEQVNSCAAACVEMRREAFGICVDGD